MMDFCRAAVVRRVQGMTRADLDFLLDSKANTIGALLLHLAATDAMYRVSTLEGKTWGAYDDKLKVDWNVPMNLGDPARKTIKGNDLEYYLTALKNTREATLAEFRKRDDQWLMTVDPAFPWGPTNNYCKFFHVCEHESHHDGQIAIIKGRLPGAKSAANG